MYNSEINLDNVNPYEVKKGLNLELKEANGDRDKAIKKVLGNLETHPAYYSELEHFNTNVLPQHEDRKPSFKTYLKNKNKDIDMTEVKLRETVKELAKKIISEEYSEYMEQEKNNNSGLLNQVQSSLNTLTNELKELALEYSKSKDKSVVTKMRQYNEERQQLEQLYNQIIGSELTETQLGEINVPYSPNNVVTNMKESLNQFEMVLKNLSINGWMGERVVEGDLKGFSKKFEELRNDLTELENSMDEVIEGWR
jgi:hypothetical protein